MLWVLKILGFLLCGGSIFNVKSAEFTLERKPDGKDVLINKDEKVVLNPDFTDTGSDGYICKTSALNRTTILSDYRNKLTCCSKDEVKSLTSKSFFPLHLVFTLISVNKTEYKKI